MLKQLFCKHKNNEVICWHWIQSNNTIIEIQLKCLKCDKYCFKYIKGWNKCKVFMTKYIDKQWSENCRPVL